MSSPPVRVPSPSRWRVARLVASLLLALALAAASVILLGPAAMAATSGAQTYADPSGTWQGQAPVWDGVAGTGHPLTETFTVPASVTTTSNLSAYVSTTDPTLTSGWPSVVVPAGSTATLTLSGSTVTATRSAPAAGSRWVTLYELVSSRNVARVVWDMQAPPPATTTPPASSTSATSSAPASSTSAAATSSASTPPSTDSSTPTTPPATTTAPTGTTVVTLDDDTRTQLLAGLALLVFFSAATFVASLGKG